MMCTKAVFISLRSKITYISVKMLLQQVRLTRNWSKNDYERTMFHGVHYKQIFPSLRHPMWLHSNCWSEKVSYYWKNTLKPCLVGCTKN